MKINIFKSIVLLSLMTSSVVFAQTEEGGENQNKSSINKVIGENDGIREDERGIPSGVYYMFLGASGASPTYSSADYGYSGGGCMRVNSGGGVDGDFDINVLIPDGHEIRGFRYYWYDASVGDTSAYFFKFDGIGGLTTIDIQSSTGDTGYGSFYLDFAADHVVDNASGHYVMRFKSSEDGNDQRMCGVRLAINKP